jgi:hypothetical protein
VAVLLVICGGIAFTAWRVIPAADEAGAAGAASPPARPAVTAAAPAPATRVPTPSPAVVPPGSPAVPFGTAGVVRWRDGLEAIVFRARHFDLPEDQAALHPGWVEIGVEAVITNNSPVDIVVTPAAMRMWYGPDRKPAYHYDGSISHTGDGFFGTVHSGHSANGGYSFAVPPEYMRQLVIELVPRPGDAPGLFAGSVD